MIRIYHLLLSLLIVLIVSFHAYPQGIGSTYKTAIYTRAYEVQKMSDSIWLQTTWQTISSQLHVDKIYLETHRDLLIVDNNTLKKVISFFKSKGVEVAGGITFTIDESNQFQTYCYTNPEIRVKAKEVIEYTASFFDEIILDDFFFTSCKCDYCVKAKGERSWTDFRLELMTNAARDLILQPAKKVNPHVKVVIKYPNWYDHFQGLGFNLETEPRMFDGIYSGTETRDAVMSNQHLQPYLSYLVYRYYYNLKPGKNGGGWVDTGGMRFYDRYAEQLWLTLLAKAPEITLFDYRQMLIPLRQQWEPEWKGEDVSFDYKRFLPVTNDNTMAKTAAHSLDIISKVTGKLGNPYGLKSYKPFHSSGEDFLQNYFGMIGIPMDIVPEFPADAPMIILTEQAKYDPLIVTKIEQRLVAGKDVIITSGLLRALQEKGIRNIVDLVYTDRKSMVEDFLLGRGLIKGTTPMIIPQIQYFTNDSWEIISGMDGGLGWPMMHQGKYANGTLYLLVVPENFADLYNLPVEVLNKIREIACKNLGIALEGPAMVSLFLYDNNSFVVHSFSDSPVDVKILLDEKGKALTDMLTTEKHIATTREPFMGWGKKIGKAKYVYTLQIPPHSFKALKIEQE
jgi:hypothetical protein